VAPTARLPIVANVMASPEKPEVVRILEAARIPCAYFPETAASVLAALVRHAELSGRMEDAPAELSGIDVERARLVVEGCLSRGGGMLHPAEAAELLSCYGVSQPAWGLARTPEEAAEVAASLGFPVVLKAVARGLVHRSDEDAVLLDLPDAHGVSAAAADLLDRFAGREPSLFVQAQAPKGVELIVGASAAPGMGHTVVFGLGGIHVEALRDVALGLAPVSAAAASRMVRSIRAARLLDGSRGRRGVDRAELEGLVSRVSRLVTDLPEVIELDLNPVIARPEGERALAVDVRVRVRESA
jgi:acetyltransferase